MRRTRGFAFNQAVEHGPGLAVEPMRVLDDQQETLARDKQLLV
jgi:hypothetical protein